MAPIALSVALLQDHTNELPAALLLAQYRAGAARARADLRAMGVEP